MEIAIGVCVSLIQGALSYVGGKLMQSALGGASILDVHAWIREAVTELEAFLSAKLEETAMQSIAADLDQSNTNIKEYASLSVRERKKNRYLIEDADISAVKLISFSLNYRQAFFISLAALGYLLFARMALYEDDRATGHITTLKEKIDETLVKALATYQFMVGALTPDGRIRIIDDEDSGAPGQYDGSGYLTPGIPGYYYSYVTLDGHSIGDWFTDDRDKASAHRRAQEFADSSVRPAVQAKFDEFKTQGIKALQLIVECYSRMCKKVGKNYVPPVDLGMKVRGTFYEISLPTILTSGALCLGHSVVVLIE